MKKKKLLAKALLGRTNLRFSDLQSLLLAFGFRLSRSKGSHFLYKHPVIPDLINIQNDGGYAKPYQVEQFLSLVEFHNLEMED